MKRKAYLGIDVGSVTTKFAVLAADDELLASIYMLTSGQPVEAVQDGLRRTGEALPPDVMIDGAAATGSARSLAGAIAGADLVKNEITCQAAGSLWAVPGVQTVMEIGGQDSKLIIIRDGLVTDFGMNTVCAAGTGSFLDHQATRLGMSIEEFSRRAFNAAGAVKLNARCTVFAESDMVHKQQAGKKMDDIIYGLCRALVRNYLSDVGAGKELVPPVVFQGGVAFNRGMLRAFREELAMDITVPAHHEIMGAIGAAVLAREQAGERTGPCRFTGFAPGTEYEIQSFECSACPTGCDIITVLRGNDRIAAWGGKCDKWHIEQVEEGVQ